MKGILLAGGKATRLYPITKGVCKQLLPVYDKPMVYYPLSVLMLAGIRDILLISNPQDTPRFKDLLGDGADIGVRLSYAAQEEPRGIAESLLIAEDFIGRDSVCLILGDNIFYGTHLIDYVTQASRLRNGAIVFGYYVNAPQRYGVIAFDRSHRVISIEEKPKKPKSHWAITGLYFYDNKAADIAKRIRPSRRGELEITDVNNAYLKKGALRVKLLGRGYAWLDTGTCDSLIDASIFIKTIEERQGLKIGCVEEIAWRKGYIDTRQLKKLAHGMPSAYAEYLRKIAGEK